MIDIKVSIIIPVFNVEKYLNECLHSAVNQNFDDYEIIIINDGSTDCSMKVADEYKNKYPNITIINQDNKGQSSARNKGIDLSRGKYVYFLDSDDFIDSNLLKDNYEIAEKNNLDIVCFDANVFYENNMLKNKIIFKYDRTNHLDDRIMDGIEFYKVCKEKSVYSSSPCIQFFKKEFLISNSIKFKEGIIHEDELFTITALISNPRIKYINKKYFNRRVRENSTMTSKKSMKNVLGFEIAANELMQISKKRNLEEKKIEIILERAETLYNIAIGLSYIIKNQGNYEKYEMSLFEDRIKSSITNIKTKSIKLKIKARYPYLSYKIWKLIKSIN